MPDQLFHQPYVDWGRAPVMPRLEHVDVPNDGRYPILEVPLDFEVGGLRVAVHFVTVRRSRSSRRSEVCNENS